jgi:hypothetical protein
MPAFTLLHGDELERSGRWLLVRRSLGLTSYHEAPILHGTFASMRRVDFRSAAS